MKRVLMLLFVLALLIPATGCYKNQIVTSPDYNPSATMPDYDQLQIHILGLIPTTDRVILNEVCPNGAGVVESQMLFGLYALSFSKIQVYCQGGTAEADVIGSDLSAQLH